MIKNKQVLSLAQGLKSVSGLSGIKFAYGVAKNAVIVDREIEVFQTTTKASEKFQEYDKKRVELAEKMSLKDEKGNPVIKDQSYVPEDKKAFDKAIDSLKSGYKEAVEEREKQIDAFNKFLEEESTIKLYMINFDDVPKEITAGQLTSIMSIIKEEEPTEKSKTPKKEKTA